MSWKQFRHSDRSGHSGQSQSIQRKMKSASNELSNGILVSKKNDNFFQRNSPGQWRMTERGRRQGVENGGEPRLFSFPTRKKPAPPDRWRQPVVVQDSVVSKNTEGAGLFRRQCQGGFVADLNRFFCIGRGFGAAGTAGNPDKATETE